MRRECAYGTCRSGLMSTVLADLLSLLGLQAGPDTHPCLAYSYGETHVINSRQPCSMREKKEGHPQADLSRPRREWLTPGKGKPSVLLWEQTGEDWVARDESEQP